MYLCRMLRLEAENFHCPSSFLTIILLATVGLKVRGSSNFRLANRGTGNDVWSQIQHFEGFVVDSWFCLHSVVSRNLPATQSSPKKVPASSRESRNCINSCSSIEFRISTRSPKFFPGHSYCADAQLV